MECNKDEASRSRDIAEQRFLQHDLVGAKKFALKAQHLFPDLEGLPQLMAVLDVHIIAKNKLNGMEVNWYGILQTDATADDATIRKQYRKLALVLHPDKNKAVGAEGAFKLISEAWGVLSDKEKKAAHDARRRVSSNNMWSTQMNCRGNSPNFTYFSSASRMHSKPPTFWTACPFCKMQFEYKRIHEKKELSCPTCRRKFLATEIMANGSTSFQPPEQSSNKYAGNNTGRTPGQQPVPSMSEEADTNCSGQNDRGAGFHGSCGLSELPKVGAGGDAHPSHQPGIGTKNKSFCHENIDPTCRSTAWNYSNFGFFGAQRSRAANARVTVEMVHQTYETVRKERVQAQKEAREEAMNKWVEAQKEARRKERAKVDAHKEARRRERSPTEAQKESRRERKQKRRQEEIEKREREAQHAKKAFDKLFATDHKISEQVDVQQKVESGPADACQRMEERNDAILTEEVDNLNVGTKCSKCEA